MRLRTLVAAVIFAMALGACDASESTEGGDTTTTIISAETTRTLPPIPTAGDVDEYLASFDPARFGGIGLPAKIETERIRVPEEVEASFVEAVRDDPANDQVGPIVGAFDDESLLYLGYLYCAAHDESETIAPSVAAVVDVVTRANGRAATTPADDDFVTSVTIVNLASGSLCPELYLDTRSFLDDLLGTA